MSMRRDLAQLLKNTFSRTGGVLVSVIMSNQFDQERVRERCKPALGLEEYVQQGLGQRQKRNPKVEAIVSVYKRMFRRWLSRRHLDLKDRDGETANLSRWVFEIAPDFFKEALPKQIIVDTLKSAPKRRKMDDESSVKTGDSSSARTVETSSAPTDNTSIVTLSNLGSFRATDDGDSVESVQTDNISPTTTTTESTTGPNGQKRRLDTL